MMWGEFEDDEKQTSEPIPNTDSRRQACAALGVVEQSEASPDTSLNSSDDCCTDDTLLSLPDRIVHHLASSTITVKSQQRYEPDLTYQERKDILSKLLQDKPGQFLYRFGKHLCREHLQHFLVYEGDAEVDHYLSEAQKHLNTHTTRIRVRNRRYAALERLRRQGDYFSEREMEQRDPLLYNQLIAQHQTQQEREESQIAVDRTNLSFSSMLLEHIDLRAHNDLRRQQEEEENDMLEEGDSDEEETEEEEEGRDGLEGGGEEEGVKRLYREEFYSVGYNDFLGGRHKDFDYGQVDASEDYDLLEIRARDEEESYFDQDSDDSLGHMMAGECEASNSNLTKKGPNVEDRVSEDSVKKDDHIGGRTAGWVNAGDSKMAIDAPVNGCTPAMSEVTDNGVQMEEKMSQVIKANETMELG